MDNKSKALNNFYNKVFKSPKLTKNIYLATEQFIKLLLFKIKSSGMVNFNTSLESRSYLVLIFLYKLNVGLLDIANLYA